MADGKQIQGTIDGNTFWVYEDIPFDTYLMLGYGNPFDAMDALRQPAINNQREHVG